MNILWPRNQLRTLCHIKIYPAIAVVKNLIELVLSEPESLRTPSFYPKDEQFYQP